MKKYSGLLFIGDVNLSKSKPGRRLDDNFYAIAKHKLLESLDHAEKNNLKPIIIGKLLKRVFEISVYSDLINILKGRDVLVISSSNELKGGLRLPNAHSSLNLLSKSNVITLSNEPELVEKILINGFVVNLFSSPEYMGHPINFGIAEGVNESEKTVLLFKSMSDDVSSKDYVEEISKEKNNIPGCDLVVNNRMSADEHYYFAGKTGWLDTGPLVRSELFECNLTPKFWVWSPEKDPTFETPSYEKHIFDESGLTEDKINNVHKSSEFSNLLREQSEKAKNGELDSENFIENELKEIMADKDCDFETSEIIRDIFNQTKTMLSPI